MTLDGRTRPDEITAVDLACFDATDDTELTTRNTRDDHRSMRLRRNDQRRGGVRVSGLEIVDLLRPDDLSGLGVESDEFGVERAEVDLVAMNCGATIDDVTTWQNAFGQTCVVLPDFLAGLGVNCPHAAIGTGDVHHAILDQRLCLLTPHLLAAERHCPRGNEARNGILIDFVERAVALALGAKAIGDDIRCCLGVLDDVIDGDVCERRLCERKRQRQRARRCKPFPGLHWAIPLVGFLAASP